MEQSTDTSNANLQAPENTERVLPMPVVFVSSHATRGGSERYLDLLFERLDPAWIRSIVCLQEGPFSSQLQMRNFPVQVIETGPRLWHILRSAKQLRDVVHRSGARVVHANGVKAALVAVVACRRTGVPVIWLKHDVSRDGWQARFIASRCSLVLGVSSVVTESLQGRTKTKIEVLHPQIPEPVVDREAAHALVRDLFEPDRPTLVIALVGRLDPLKGHREMLAAASSIAERESGLGFLFVGGSDPAHPGYAESLKQDVRELRLGDSVRFTGHREDALALIAGSDVLVIPSIVNKRGMGREAFPYVGLEALALGTPIVAYAHGGVPEQIGECGILVPPGDRQELAAAILRLSEDGELRDRLTHCGRERFRARYALSSLVDEICQRYRAAASTRGSR